MAIYSRTASPLYPSSLLIFLVIKDGSKYYFSNKFLINMVKNPITYYNIIMVGNRIFRLYALEMNFYSDYQS